MRLSRKKRQPFALWGHEMVFWDVDFTKTYNIWLNKTITFLRQFPLNLDRF